MFIIDLVRSATDKAAPMTEHPRLVVGGLVTAYGLVVLSFTWAILPWGGWVNLIVTLLGAVTLVAAVEVTHKKLTTRKKAKIAALEAVPQPAPTLVDQTSPVSDNPAPPNDEYWSREGAETQTAMIPVIPNASRKPPIYNPEKWPQYSDYLASLDPTERHDLWVTEQLERSHQEAAYAEALADEDDTIHWKKRPHVKYFWKRIWWRALIVIPAEFIVVYFGIGAIQNFGLPAWLYLVPLFALLWGVWYGYRRWYKWHELYLVIQGSWLIIEKAKNPWLGLYGKKANSPRVPLISCNNITPSESFWESIRRPPWKRSGRPLFNSGRIDINTSIPDKGDGGASDAYDDFRQLTDVVDHLGFADEVETRHDSLISGRPTIIRTLQSNG